MECFSGVAMQVNFYALVNKRVQAFVCKISTPFLKKQSETLFLIDPMLFLYSKAIRIPS
jgi:hypothetical protein